MSYAVHYGSLAGADHQPVPWEDVDAVFEVLRRLTDPTPPSQALEDWIAEFTNHFKPIWTSHIRHAEEQEILSELRSLPSSIARRRRNYPRYQHGERNQAPVILATDLPPVQEFADIVRSSEHVPQVRPWGYQSTLQTQNGTTTNFRPVNRNTDRISLQALNDKLDATVKAFPKTGRHYSFRDRAQTWVDLFKEVKTFQRWGSLSKEQQQYIWRKLSNVPTEIRRRRNRKIRLDPAEVLATVVKLNLDTHLPPAALPSSAGSTALGTRPDELMRANNFYNYPSPQLPLPNPGVPVPRPSFSQGYRTFNGNGHALDAYNHRQDFGTFMHQTSTFVRPAPQEMIASDARQYYGTPTQYYGRPSH